MTIKAQITLLTVPEAAEIIRAEHRTVRRAIHTGDLEAALIGGRWLIRLEALEDWFDKRAASSSRPRRAAPGGTRSSRPATPSADRAGSVTRLRAIK